MMDKLIDLLVMMFLLIGAVRIILQYRQRHALQHVLWGLALILLSVSIGCRLVGTRNGGTPILLWVWYLTRGMLPVAFLGQGAVYLLVERRIAHVSMFLLSLSVAVAVWGMTREPLVLMVEGPSGRAAWSGDAMPTMVHMLALCFHAFGAIALVAALWLVLWYLDCDVEGRKKLWGVGLVLLGALIAFAGAPTPGEEQILVHGRYLVGGLLVGTGAHLTVRPYWAWPRMVIGRARRRRQRRAVGTILGAASLLGILLLVSALSRMDGGAVKVSDAGRRPAGQFPSVYLGNENRASGLDIRPVSLPPIPSGIPVWDATPLVGRPPHDSNESR